MSCSSGTSPYVPGENVPAPDSYDGAESGDSADLSTLDGWETDNWKEIVLEEPSSEPLLAFLETGGIPHVAYSGGSLGEAAPPPSFSTGLFISPLPDSLVLDTDDGFTQELAPAQFATPYLTLPPVPLRKPAKIEANLWEASRTVVGVTAVFGSKTLRRELLVTANTGFPMDARLQIQPGTVFEGEPYELSFRISLNTTRAFDQSKVYLQEADATCSSGSKSQFMLDDGDMVDGCDEVPSDRVFSVCSFVGKDEKVGVKLFRVALTAQTTEGPMVVYSPCAALRIIKRPARIEVETARNVLREARDLLVALLGEGDSVDDAAKKTLAHLRGKGGVKQSGAIAGGGPIWVLFSSGLLGAVPSGLDQAGTGLPEIFEKTGAPGAGIAPASRRMAFEGPVAAGLPFSAQMEARGCPGWRVRNIGNLLRGSWDISSFGALLLANGGGRTFGGLSDEFRAGQGWATGDGLAVFDGWQQEGSQDLLWSSTQVDASVLSSSYQSCFYKLNGTCCINCSKDPPEYCSASLQCVATGLGSAGAPTGFIYDQVLAELAAGRLVIGPDNYGLLPSWFQSRSRQTASGRLAWLGAGDSMTRGSAAAALLLAGFDTVIGFKGPVSAAQGSSLLSGFLAAALDLEAQPGQLLPACGQVSSGLCYLGAGDLDLHAEGPLDLDMNPAQALAAWDHSGDARLLSEWCGVSGEDRNMALISTGLGFAVQKGELMQTFCLPEGSTELSFRWNMISYEWPESCGKTWYHDSLSVKLVSGSGEELPITVASNSDSFSINDLCSPQSCGCDGPGLCSCGALYDENQPLSPWPQSCGFDDGDAFSAGWRMTGPVNISSFAGLGVPVTLSFTVSDKGDANNDSTILIDALIIR